MLQQCAGADICLFQETPDGGGSIQPDDLTGEWAAAFWLDVGDCGILSKHPLRELPSRQVGPWSAPQVVEVDLPGDQIMVLINVRLMLPSLVLNPWTRDGFELLATANHERTKQFQNLAKLVRELEVSTTAPLVLGGDFNTRGGSKLLSPLKSAGLRDLWQGSGRGWGRTMTRDFPVARIDQLWGSRGVQAVELWSECGPISDHRLVRARIHLH